MTRFLLLFLTLFGPASAQSPIIEYIISDSGTLQYMAPGEDYYRNTYQVVKDGKVYCSDQICFFQNPRNVLIVLDSKGKHPIQVNQARDFEIATYIDNHIFLKKNNKWLVVSTNKHGRVNSNYFTTEIHTELNNFFKCSNNQFIIETSELTYHLEVNDYHGRAKKIWKNDLRKIECSKTRLITL